MCVCVCSCLDTTINQPSLVLLRILHHFKVITLDRRVRQENEFLIFSPQNRGKVDFHQETENKSDSCQEEETAGMARSTLGFEKMAMEIVSVCLH